MLGGIAFGYSITPNQQRRVITAVSGEWKKLSNKDVREGIKYLYRLDFIEKESTPSGLITLKLTKRGRLIALDKQLENIKNSTKKWDGKWRMVAFDIPEKYKTGRDALRHKLKKIGFCELQKSVLVTPFDCGKEIMMLVKFFELEKYVRFGVLDYVDNENMLKNTFKL